MKRIFMSKLATVLVTVVILTSAVVVGLASYTPGNSHAAKLPATTTAGEGGRLWVTGHFPDFTCLTSEGALCHYLQVAVSFVMNGSTLPILALDPTASKNLASDINNAFTNDGLTVPIVDTVVPRTGFASLPLINSNGKPLYSAIVVASDYSSYVDCSDPICFNTGGTVAAPDSEALNARSADIATFFKAGGGILAMAGGPTSNVYYNFLPIPVSVASAQLNNNGFTLTSLGQSRGLTSGDVNNCCFYSTNDFQLPSSGSPLQLVETDSAGNAETLIANGTLWGVDSFDHITQSFYKRVTSTFGAPAFWGRYIGQGRPKDMALTEASFAHAHGFAILPIYFNYTDTQVKGYDTGKKYAQLAIEDAQRRLGISQGVAIFVDIEEETRPDAAFIQGWYDRFNSNFTDDTIKGKKFSYQAGYYKAGYYANTKNSSHFDTPFCTALSKESSIATNSFIWTTQPFKGFVSAKTTQAKAPAYSPVAVSCPPHQIPIPAAWQYSIQPKPPFPPNVDLDEANSSLPLWHPVV